MPYSYVPYICEGEIIGVQEPSDFTKENRVMYICRVQFTNGSEIVVPNVEASTIFGGIDDYFQERARTSDDSGGGYKPSAIDANNDAQIGARVYIAFVGGSLNRPIIVSHAQHPNQTQEFEDPQSLSPQAVLKYLGMRTDFFEDGALRITHFGAPEVEFVESSAASGAAQVLSAAADLITGGGGGDKPNPAVTPQPLEKKTIMDFGSEGQWRVRDSEGQLIDIDRTNTRIYISNNDTPSTEEDPQTQGPSISANNTDAEYLLFDKSKELILMNARDTIQLYSFNKRADVTEGDHTHEVLSNEILTVKGDKEDTIEGGLTESVKADYKQSVSGNAEITVKGDNKHTVSGSDNKTISGDIVYKSTGDTTVATDAGATLKLSSNTVALGTSTAEVVDTLSQTMQSLLDTLNGIVALTVPTPIGPSGPPINAATFSQVISAVTSAKAKLDAIKGSV